MSIPTRMKGFGSTLGYATTVGGSYTTLTGLMKQTPPKPKAAQTKTSDLSSANQVHTYQRGWIDGGELQCEAYFDKVQYAALLALFSAGTQDFWKVTYPLVGAETVASFMTVPGFISELGISELSIDDENLVMIPFTIKLSDVPTFTAGT